MKFISNEEFVNNCLLAFQNGKLDSIDLGFRERAKEATVESLTKEFENIPALRYFLWRIEPLKDEYLINWTPEIYKEAETYILTNFRFIYSEKGVIKTIKNKNIESVSVSQGPLKVKLKIQMNTGEEKIIKMTAAPNQTAWDLVLK